MIWYEADFHCRVNNKYERSNCRWENEKKQKKKKYDLDFKRKTLIDLL